MFRWLLQSTHDSIVGLMSHLTGWLSFNGEIESLVDAVNHKLDEPPTRLNIRHLSHPGGFIRDFGKRRLSIAGAYIKIARDLSPNSAEERLTALSMLVDQSLHAKTINMPLNTARIQIDLMKEVVKSRSNRRRQMEAMADFGLVSFGQEAVVRRFLNKLHLVEVPEEERPLRELDMGWDDHVHDFLSEGRKTPTQVLLDAFVKGISRLTLVYSNLDERRMIHEAITAGNLLGIKVSIGIEFSVGRSGARRHYMYVPPETADSKQFFAFFDERRIVFAPFLTGLRTNATSRHKTMVAAVERFNTLQRPRLNSGWEPDSPCWFPPLTLEELDRIVACGQISRVHIGELLFQKFRDILQRRVLQLKAQVLAARDRLTRGIYSEWEFKNITSQYESVREQYETMTPESLRSAYMEGRDVVDYDSEFAEEEPILDTLMSQGGRIVMIHPLEIGLKDSMLHLLRHSGRITHIETLNLRDSSARNPNDLIVFNKFIYLLNNGTEADVLHFLEQHGITGGELVKNTLEITQKRPLVPVCGSDSTGRDPTIPGMGFIKVNNIPESVRPEFLESHYKVPRPIADLVIREGKKDESPDTPIGSASDVVCMGKIGKPFRNLVGDEETLSLVPPGEFWAYLNPGLKFLWRIAVGFVVAFSFMNFQYGQLLGVLFAALWFVITGSRNMLVDLLASSGIAIRNWSLRNVNFDNISQSLFWTGFSVPILGLIKIAFDDSWPLEKAGFLFEGAKFFFLCISNGIYISTHNRLRNFDRRVIRANFFRTVLAWPFATVFAPFGNLIGVPSIVQAKFWSDVVGGVIEGSGKYRQRVVIRIRDLGELLPRLSAADRDIRLTAMLDILYIWARQPRGHTCLAKLLHDTPTLLERMRLRRARHTPEETQQRKAEARKHLDRLLELFGDPGCLNLLSEFVLKNYQEREAILLTELIGSQTEPFLAWLKEIRQTSGD
ncbi:MAG TPA: hypothetical protein PLP29_05115 [Candidatus Ozemobacteraceae bacterium]|nr:hypothetical protein [Candidatus Ozemobacteraceae bacterium]